MALAAREFPFTLEQIRAEKAERRLRDFVPQAWHVVKPKAPFVGGWHVDAICDHLEAVTRSEIKNLLVTIPPRYTKSTTVCVCWPAWTWLHRPEFQWLFSAYAAILAVRDSVLCRRVIDSAWYQGNWGDRYYLTTDQNEKSRFDNSATGRRMATGLVGGTGEGGDAIVVDDPHNINDQWYPSKMEAAVNEWDQVMSQRINDENARKVIIMQRISDKDLAAHVLEQGGYEHLMIPQEYDPKRSKVTVLGWKDPRKQPGELISPKRFSVRAVAEARVRLGVRGFNSQHQQNPSTDEAAIFKRIHWCYYKDDPKEVAKKMDVVIQSWDMKFKDTKTKSKVAGHVWGGKGADRYLLQRVCEHYGFTDSMRAVVAATTGWPMAVAKLIEGKANGPAIVQVLKKHISGLIDWPPEGEKMGSKVARASACQPEHEAHNLWLPDPKAHPWVEEFVEYMAAFPNAEYNDDADAMSQALEYLRRKTQGSNALPFGVEGKNIWKIK